MKSLLNKLCSMGIGIILLLVFALSCIVATFIENDFGTSSAISLIYCTWWFGAVQVWLCVIVLYNINRYKLYTKDKMPSFIFHLSFLFILLGSGLTRYYGFEGNIHIREGENQNLVTSLSSYVQIKGKKDGKIYKNDIDKIFSTAKGNWLLSLLNTNSFTLNLDVDGKMATLKYEDIIFNPVKKVVEDKSSNPIVSLVVSANSIKPTEIVLNKGEDLTNRAISIDFSNKPIDNKKHTLQFHISLENGKFFFVSNYPVSWYKMSDGTKGVYEKNTKTPFVKKQLYTIEGINIVPKALLLKGKQKWVSGERAKNGDNTKALIVKLTYNNITKEVVLYGQGRGSKGKSRSVMVSNVPFILEWGAKMYELPFKLKLIDFQLDRYPGSMSPSSYASEVKVIDKKRGINMPYRIYMNHVLDYAGFRFFQSSYDRDEKGTILSVNQDPGKWPTYFGYTLLFLGLLFNIFNPKSRFRKLAQGINKEAVTKSVAFLALGFLFSANGLRADVPVYEKQHADLFATILSQSADGRIKPVDTIATEVLLKVYRGTKIGKQNANQVLLGMITSPKAWQSVPMIKVYDKEIKKILGIKSGDKYASFDDFFNSTGKKEYKLIKQIEEAKRKKPSKRDQFDKDIIKVDERLNICYYVYTGEILKIFPLISDKDRRWFSPNSAVTYFPKQESIHVQSMLEEYFNGAKKGLSSGDWSEADRGVERIKSYQKQYANDIIPSQGRISTEISFNHAQIFFKLFPVYLIAGFILLLAIFAKMIFPSLSLQWAKIVILGIVVIAFITHTIGLGMRWYISGHAPWSDGYESMVYISWALALSGIIFARNSLISLSLTSILAGISLFVAHLSWMDPQITNLVPVLKSYWLTIHVSVITASYGFLGLCALLGFFTLILIILRNPKREDKRNHEIDRSINEASKINEMAMILGLTLLTIGNFLGGVWANESWGRYWGWDAKETWALISILIYAAVVHLRFIPKLNNQYVFAVSSAFAYWSILMTYFGVNFYLSGMHSYASGDPVPIPTFVPVVAFVMLLVSVVAFFNRKITKKL